MVISMTAHISDDGLGREESVAEHTEKTTFLCAQKGKRCGLSKVMSLCGLFHDLGKNKQKFHDYLHEDESTRQKLRGSIAHASTGAKYIYDRYHGEEGSKKYMAEMISYAIAAHHGLFDCVDEDHTDIFSEKLDKVEDYDTACINAEKDYLNTYERDKILADACQEFDIIWNKIKVLFDRLKPMVASKNEKDKREALYDCRLFLFSCLQRLILSLLIDSDWEATSDFMDNVDTLTKQSEFYPQDDPQEIFRQAKENFDIYMEKRRQSANISRMSDREKKIFDARNSLQSACRQFARHPAGVYCLPIPTGGGKTLSGLAYALEYCGQHREVERVIYVSPYISITEQNARVFRQVVLNHLPGAVVGAVEHGVVHGFVVNHANALGFQGLSQLFARRHYAGVLVLCAGGAVGVVEARGAGGVGLTGVGVVDEHLHAAVQLHVDVRVFQQLRGQVCA